jgi:sugar phosphate isomerase/epimerase
MTLLSMSEITTFRWTFEQDIENYQQAGFRAIGVWRQKLADWDEDDAVEMLVESGLTVSNLVWAGGFTGSDGRTPADSIDDAIDALRLAGKISAGCLVVYPGGRNNHTFRHAGRLLRDALKELLPLAEAVEVPIAIEPMHPACAHDWTFITDLESVLALIEEFGSPCLKIAYDTYHFPFAACERKTLARLAPHIGIAHLDDRVAAPTLEQERCLLGHGRLPLSDTVATLRNAGYTGAFDVKLLGPEIESCDYWSILEQSQAAFSDFAATPRPHSLACRIFFASTHKLPSRGASCDSRLCEARVPGGRMSTKWPRRQCCAGWFAIIPHSRRPFGLVS